ncbi:MAG: hypothetical protein RR636_02465 [Clostridium sp.]|uniref:hypothetical protein n=1 Tax=Clostridium sp. TaxID=1506 RepID=UPI00302F1B62
MNKFFYCVNCKAIINEGDVCPCCKESYIKELEKGTSVSVIGQKIKGKIFRTNEDSAEVIIIAPNKERIIKEYSIKELRKIL